jgi:TetR/AcrR family fatty acid metabolism transcriptional regulator
MNEQPRTRTRTRLAPGIRRASILDAATRLLLRHGAAGLTMEDIATEAGVARGTLYLYFDSVDGITGALRDRYAQALTGELEPLLATGGSGSRLRRLDTFIAALAGALHDHRELHHALFTHAGAAEDPLTAAFRALLRRFILDGRDAGEFPVPDPDLTAAFLLAGLHAVLTEGLHKTSTATTVAAAQKLARRTLSA